jgi:Uri superfamily endonuclease
MTRIIKRIPESKGVYVIFFRSAKEAELKIGSLGVMPVKPGIYAYVGSACGGGGLKSRLARHLKTSKKCRWHIDYLRRHVSFERLWWLEGGASLECVLASGFAGADVPMPGFGSSDCRCVSHLFYMHSVPEPCMEGVRVL